MCRDDSLGASCPQPPMGWGLGLTGWAAALASAHLPAPRCARGRSRVTLLLCNLLWAHGFSCSFTDLGSEDTGPSVMHDYEDLNFLKNSGFHV